MSNIHSRRQQIHGQNVSAAAGVPTDFSIAQEYLRGADIASATQIAVPQPGAYSHVTGSTPISFISTTGLMDGKEFDLYFIAGTTLRHNAAPPPVGTVAMRLISGADTPASAGATASFRYDASLGAVVQITGFGSGVIDVSPGTGISITGTALHPVVNNTGVLALSAGPGISITGTVSNPVVNNTGVLSAVAGQSIVLTGAAQNPVINNDGVWFVSAGPGISVTGTVNQPVVNNAGVISISAGTNIIISGSGSNPIITAVGSVQSVSSGPGISITGTALNPIVNNTGILSATAGPGISIVGGQNPVVSAKVIGNLQLGGLLDAAGSLSQWFPGGWANLPSTTAVEFPIDQFVDAGATAMRYIGDLNSLLGTGANFYLTCNGAAIPGTSFSYSTANVGGVTDVTVAIPAAASAGPRAGRRSIGLGIFGNGSTQIAYLANVVFT